MPPQDTKPDRKPSSRDNTSVPHTETGTWADDRQLESSLGIFLSGDIQASKELWPHQNVLVNVFHQHVSPIKRQTISRNQYLFVLTQLYLSLMGKITTMTVDQIDDQVVSDFLDLFRFTDARFGIESDISDNSIQYFLLWCLVTEINVTVNSKYFVYTDEYSKDLRLLLDLDKGQTAKLDGKYRSLFSINLDRSQLGDIVKYRSTMLSLGAVLQNEKTLVELELNITNLLVDVDSELIDNDILTELLLRIIKSKIFYRLTRATQCLIISHLRDSSDLGAQDQFISIYLHRLRDYARKLDEQAEKTNQLGKASTPRGGIRVFFRRSRPTSPAETHHYFNKLWFASGGNRYITRDVINSFIDDIKSVHLRNQSEWGVYTKEATVDLSEIFKLQCLVNVDENGLNPVQKTCLAKLARIALVSDEEFSVKSDAIADYHHLLATIQGSELLTKIVFSDPKLWKAYKRLADALGIISASGCNSLVPLAFAHPRLLADMLENSALRADLTMGDVFRYVVAVCNDTNATVDDNFKASVITLLQKKQYGLQDYHVVILARLPQVRSTVTHELLRWSKENRLSDMKMYEIFLHHIQLARDNESEQLLDGDLLYTLMCQSEVWRGFHEMKRSYEITTEILEDIVTIMCCKRPYASELTKKVLNDSQCTEVVKLIASEELLVEKLTLHYLDEWINQNNKDAGIILNKIKNSSELERVQGASIGRLLDAIDTKLEPHELKYVRVCLKILRNPVSEFLDPAGLVKLAECYANSQLFRDIISDPQISARFLNSGCLHSEGELFASLTDFLKNKPFSEAQLPSIMLLA